MNVLFLSHETGMMGGSSFSLYNMILACGRQGIKAYVIMPKYNQTYTFFTNHGIKCYVIGFKMNVTSTHHGLYHYAKYIPRYIYDGLYNIISISRIVSKFKEKHIHIVHSNTSIMDIGPVIAKKLNARHVWHLREFQDKDFEFEPFKGWKRLLRQIHNTDAVITISDSIYNHFHCELCKKAISQPNAVVDAKSKEITLKPTKKQILFCGLICKAKCPDMAIRIFSSFYKTHPDYQMIMLGRFQLESYRKYLENLISSLQLDGVVKMLGYTENVAKYYQESRVLIMSSHYEAMGRVTIEAMFNGCIVLGYNSAGTAELIEDGVTGFLFDNEKKASDKLSYICDNYEVLQKIRQHAYSYSVDNFSIDHYGEVLMNFYNGI